MFKSTIVKGAFILTLANIITRILGFVYRIYMSNFIGSEGMGLYQMITPIYLLVWAITSSGLSTTMNKLTAQEMAKNKNGNCQKLLFVSILISLSISILFSIFVYKYSDILSLYIIKDNRTCLSLKIISVCFPFMAVGSIIRGYFYGLKNTLVPAISQVFEQSVRIGIVLIFSNILATNNLEIACGIAVVGMSAGEILSFLYIGIMWLIHSKKIHISIASISYKKSFAMILTMALPLTFNRILTSALATIESILIPQKLQVFGLSKELSISILGNLNGMAMPLIMFPSSLLTALATATMPVISENHELNNHSKNQRTINQVMYITAIISAGTCGLFFTYPKEIGYLIYGESDIAQFLYLLSIVCPFIYTQVTLSGILNGLGQQLFIFKVNLLSSVINLLTIYFGIPIYGINIFIISFGLSAILTTFLTFYKLKNEVNLHLNLIKNFCYPIFAIIVSCFITKVFFKHFNIITNKINILLLITTTGIIYLFALQRKHSS